MNLYTLSENYIILESRIPIEYNNKILPLEWVDNNFYKKLDKNQKSFITILNNNLIIAKKYNDIAYKKYIEDMYKICINNDMWEYVEPPKIKIKFKLKIKENVPLPDEYKIFCIQRGYKKHQILRNIYKYIYDNNLQDKVNKLAIHVDDNLKKILKPNDNMYYTYENIGEYINYNDICPMKN